MPVLRLGDSPRRLHLARILLQVDYNVFDFGGFGDNLPDTFGGAQDWSNFESFDFDFELTDVEGNPIKLADYEGKLVIVDLWGTLHNGIEPLPGALDALERLKAQGKSIALLSNAPFRITVLAGPVPAARALARDSTPVEQCARGLRPDSALLLFHYRHSVDLACSALNHGG